jgi:site-specific DNA-cytosine methylase
MKILVACEESQRVCEAFRKKGHEAYSCDIQECSGGHPEWHIRDDVLKVLKGGQVITMDGMSHCVPKWDMIIAFPPCTHLAVSGAAWFEKKRADGRQREGIEFFCNFLEVECEKVVIENPVGIISGDYIPKYFPDLAERFNLPQKPTQIIHPWMFGDNYSKSTCLWEKGVKPLEPIVKVQPKLDWFEFTDRKTGKKKRQPKWYADALKLPAEERAKVRSKTFPGIAQAMAEQWG